MKILTAIAILLLPVLGFARGQETTVICRTAYFPAGPGSVIVVRGQQATASPMGARRTVIKSGKRSLTKAEMEALKKQYKFSDTKFGVHNTWTVITTKKQAF